MANRIYGSICLSDIPKELIKAVTCADGQVRKFLNIAVVEMKEPRTFTNGDKRRTYTHFLTCAPKKEEQKEGVRYILGSLETYTPQVSAAPTVEDINNAPIAENNEELPF